MTHSNPAARRRLLLGAAAALLAPGAARAQPAFPSKPVRVIVPFPAGVSPDVVARQWAERFARLSGQPVVVENKPGASSIIATQAAAAAPADGSTLLWTVNNTFSINPYVFRKLPYKAEDFTPVTQVLAVPYVLLVGADAPWRTLDDLLRDAKAKPGALTYASGGIGTGLHVVMARLLNTAGAHMTHIPYKDAFMPDVIGRRVDVGVDASTTAIGQIKGGRVRALAVTSAKRLEMLPEVPTVGESFPGFSGDSWQGIFVPRETPEATVQALAALSNRIVESADFRALLRDYGLPPVGSTPAAFKAFLAEDARGWAKVVKDNQITVD
ncbi:MAG: tripartite tricarboxylate transporter substrate binding protein [Rubrivivax sp.]|nr:tripartite tricarboxylate transporter substrate binding protein [Rubrivivax sp.]